VRWEALPFSIMSVFFASVFSKILRRVNSGAPPSCPDEWRRFRRLTAEPHRTRFGAGTALIVGGGGIFLGAWLSQKFAEFLEVNELFVPDDED
jgi:Putative mitochondrial precursor protein